MPWGLRKPPVSKSRFANLACSFAIESAEMVAVAPGSLLPALGCVEYNALTASGFSLRFPNASEASAIHALEAASYPEDEAASLPKIQSRLEAALPYFIALYDKTGGLVGFVNGTRCFGKVLTHESMAAHESGGESLCVHSVVIRQEDRRKGLARKLMRCYVQLMGLYDASLQHILLIAKAPLLHFYRSCGFTVEGLSSVVHGKDSWFDMSLDLATIRRTRVAAPSFTTAPGSSLPALGCVEHDALTAGGFSLRFPNATEATALHELEVASYPEDERVSLAKLQYRLEKAPGYTIGLYDEMGGLAGFVNGLRCSGRVLTHEVMATHVPDGESAYVSSVVIRREERGKGLARKLFLCYIKLMSLYDPSLQHVLLISKAPLLRFYRSCGFTVEGLSSVELGKDSWFQMSMDLADVRQQASMVLQVDAFTDEAYSGNSCAVVFTHRNGDEEWMQSLANEMNLAETSFLERRDASELKADGQRLNGSHDGASLFHLRWFTPATELDLCGHATLGAAHALWEEGLSPRGQPIHFKTESGILTASRRQWAPPTPPPLAHTDTQASSSSAAPSEWIELDFPATPPNFYVSLPAPSWGEDMMRLLEDGLGVGREAFVYVNRSIYDAFVEVDSSRVCLLDIKPDFRVLKHMDAHLRGVIVTSKATPHLVAKTGQNVHFFSRFFAPQSGIDEDPVTGSAHCSLAPYWCDKLGQSCLLGYQASARGGCVGVEMGGADPVMGGHRVKLMGKAVTVMKGTLL
ncbi:unnamed protein product [Vitrella brassicaformis CCMP3155]|uniref:N-acetyltransferase domain-containing protein n=3 Tax=Vitrella brassicaformis TaxID=1169539 RepID=A0A0G4ELI9_VITBC|nr:unnamed protein product [Vitrella brassicaformis CCMP3155]|eukprot:CEL97822.1 unnamed protein product [Vitrella brassicaformis CCMP3155]